MTQLNEIIQYDENQDIPIKLDLDNNQIIFNNDVDKILAQGDEIVAKGNELLKTDINQIDEAQMTALNKEIKPISKIQNDYLNTRKSIKKELQKRDDAILNAFDQKLNDNHFDEIQNIVTKLRVLQKDFKANRGNQRWAEVKTYFDEQMNLYPEFQQYAPETLGNFEYYRIHHDDLVSEAKTKPVNKATIKTLNEDLFNYHNDLNHLLESSLSKAYYQTIIEQYAAEPSTNKMLELIQNYNVQQLKDQNEHLIQDVLKLANTQIQNLWVQNPKINQFLDESKPADVESLQFKNYKNQLIQENADALSQSIQATDFLNTDNSINEVDLTQYLKSNIQQTFINVQSKLQSMIPEKTKTNQTSKSESKPSETKHQWLLEYLQANNWNEIHNNDKIKANVLRDLFTTITNPNSVWKANIHSNAEIIEITKFITNL